MNDHLQMAESIALAMMLRKEWISDAYDAFIYAIRHHDDGWAPFDAQVGQNPDTGLPYGIFETPPEISLQTGPKSVDLAQKHHPYSALLISMHVFGLHTGRSGLAKPKGSVQHAPEIHTQFEALLAKEARRGSELKKELGADPKTRSWVEEPHLFAHYQAMQFCDLLSLYFLTQGAELRKTMEFPYKSTNLNDFQVKVLPIDERHYQLHPYPFRSEPLEISWQSRRMAPEPLGTDVAAILASLPFEKLSVTLQG